MKRVTWFVGGVVAGAAGATYGTRKVRRKAAELAPVQVARTAAGRARGRGQAVVEAVREGRSAMRTKEAELRARLEGRAVPLADALGQGDEVLVDGRPVEPGQVIVLRQVRPGDSPPRRRSTRRRSS
jgi:hypothetical protein